MDNSFGEAFFCCVLFYFCFANQQISQDRRQRAARAAMFCMFLSVIASIVCISAGIRGLKSQVGSDQTIGIVLVSIGSVIGAALVIIIGISICKKDVNVISGPDEVIMPGSAHQPAFITRLDHPSGMNHIIIAVPADENYSSPYRSAYAQTVASYSQPPYSQSSAPISPNRAANRNKDFGDFNNNISSGPPPPAYSIGTNPPVVYTYAGGGSKGPKLSYSSSKNNLNRPSLPAAPSLRPQSQDSDHVTSVTPLPPSMDTDDLPIPANRLYSSRSLISN